MAAGGAGALRRDERRCPPAVRGDKHDDADVLLRLQQQRHSGVHHLADAGGSDLGCRGQRRRPARRSAVPRAHRHPKLSTRPAATSAFSTCIIYAAVGIALLALVWWLYKKRPSETAGDAMSFRWLRPIARWSIGLCGGLGLGLFLRYTAFIDGGFACLLICQLVMGVICFFAAQMLLKKEIPHFHQPLVGGNAGAGADPAGGDAVHQAGHHRLSAPRPGRGGRDLRPLQRQLCGFHHRRSRSGGERDLPPSRHSGAVR